MSNVTMIINAVNMIADSEKLSIEESFDKLLRYCVVKLGIDAKVHVNYNNNTFEYLNKNFKIDNLKSAMGDWFGDAYEQLGLLDKEVKLNPCGDVALKIANLQTPDGFPTVVFEKSVRTGRDLMEIYIQHGKKVLMYGVEVDKRLYHIALINISLYQLPAFILNIEDESVLYKKNFATNSPNWEFSNVWTTPGSRWLK